MLIVFKQNRCCCSVDTCWQSVSQPVISIWNWTSKIQSRLMFSNSVTLISQGVCHRSTVRQPKDRNRKKDREKSNNEKKREWNESMARAPYAVHRQMGMGPIPNRLSFMWRHLERTTSRDGLSCERVRPQTNVLLAVWAAPFRYIYTLLLCYFGGLYCSKQTNNPRWLDITRMTEDISHGWIFRGILG